MCLARTKLALLLAFSLAGAVAVTARAAGSPPPFIGPTLMHPAAPPDFALHDQHGGVVRLSKLHGKVVLLTFLYTHCPDVCPLTAANLNSVLTQLGLARKDVVVLAVSVDPKGDTPAAVNAFVRSHRLRPQFHYLTGTRGSSSRYGAPTGCRLFHRGRPASTTRSTPCSSIPRAWRGWSSTRRRGRPRSPTTCGSSCPSPPSGGRPPCWSRSASSRPCRPARCALALAAGP